MQCEELRSPANDFRVKDRVAVVTGGSRGIGRAAVKELARLGFHLAIQYKQSEAQAQDLADYVRSLEREAIVLQADISSYKDCKRIADAIMNRWPEIEVVINNAGITRDVPLVMMTESDWGEVISTNLTGVFNVTRVFIYQLIRQRKGKIINISSTAGLTGVSGQTNYCASKAGIIGFTKALAKEVARFGITVNCIAPGYVDSDMTAGMSPEKRKAALERIPLGRCGTTEEIAGLIGFLASENASYITGQVYSVDGGLVS